jgi:hypothetical protein
VRAPTGSFGRSTSGHCASGRGSGQLIFDDFLRPGDSSRVVNAEDAVTLSLLQARLIELGLPYRLREGE